jgi:chitinase
VPVVKKEDVNPPSPVVIQAPPPFGFYVVGYFPSYRNLADVPDIKFRMTNVVVYAFYGVNASGTLSAPVSPAAALSAVATKSRTNNAKIFLGINDGSGDGKTNFKNMSASTVGRNNFVKDVMNEMAGCNGRKFITESSL